MLKIVRKDKTERFIPFAKSVTCPYCGTTDLGENFWKQEVYADGEESDDPRESEAKCPNCDVFIALQAKVEITFAMISEQL